MMNYEVYVQASGDLSPSYGNFPVFMNSAYALDLNQM